jgi:hypothetical protein
MAITQKTILIYHLLCSKTSGRPHCLIRGSAFNILSNALFAASIQYPMLKEYTTTSDPNSPPSSHQRL